MFGFVRVAMAKNACVQALAPFVARPGFLGPWQPQYWRDPYVIGFLMHVITTVSSRTLEWGKLNTEQRGVALLGALKEVGAPPNFNDQANMLMQSKNADFMLGGRNAETVIAYIWFSHPMPGDPDVAAATETAKVTTLTGKVDRAEIGGALIHMLFSEVVRKRIG